MKGEDGRAPLGEAVEHYGWRCRPGRGTQEQEWSVCLPSYTSGIQEKWIPRREAGLENLQFSNFNNLDILVKSIPTTCPTNNNISTVLRSSFSNLVKVSLASNSEPIKIIRLLS